MQQKLALLVDGLTGANTDDVRAGPSMTLDTFYHVTVLSNLARAYDKYARLYRKSAIPESRYPREFYVLEPQDVAIGAAKAAALRDRLALPGDALIALEVRLSRAELAPNLRTGKGLVWASPDLPVAAVRTVADDGALGAAEPIEEFMARALARESERFVAYDHLSPRSISFLPVARGCQARCPFCFSHASVSSDQPLAAWTDGAHVDRWLARARALGAERAVITGGGEPTLLGWDELLALVERCGRALGKVVLITNGVALARLDPAELDTRLVRLAAAGLSVLAVSRHHADEARNTAIMGLETRAPALFAAFRRARSDLPGMRLRAVCVLSRQGVDSAEGADAYVHWAAAEGVDEVCFKELYVATSRESVYYSRDTNAFSAAQQVPLSVVLAWVSRAGFRESARLPWGAPIFDGTVGGRPMRVAAYTEPSLFWERTRGIARSWNVMADGTCLASLEDRASLIGDPS